VGKEATAKGLGFGPHPKGVIIPAPKEALLVFSRPYKIDYGTKSLDFQMPLLASCVTIVET